MQSNNGARRYISLKQIESTAGRRQGAGATPKTAMNGGTGFAVLVLLFLASLGYVVFGGAFEMELSPEAKTAIAAAALKPADTRRAPRDEQVAGASVASTDHAPLAYVARGGDSDGNVMTYEHD